MLFATVNAALAQKELLQDYLKDVGQDFRLAMVA